MKIRQVGREIKMLRSNNGGKYTSKDLNSFCREAWIKMVITVPYNRQQNGVAERKNPSIIEIANAMVHDMYFSMCLW